MGRSGSLPWLFLAAVAATLFALYLETTLVKPFIDGIAGTEAWKTTGSEYAASGKGMTLAWVRNIFVVIAIGIWFGVLVDARRSV